MGDSVDQILDWPWQRFEAMYEAFMKRRLIESLDRRKDMMIAALWANSGFEGQEGATARKNAIHDIENNYDEAVKKIRIGLIEEEEDIDYDNPFFASMKKGMDKIQVPDEVTVREVIDMTADIDQ